MFIYICYIIVLLFYLSILYFYISLLHVSHHIKNFPFLNGDGERWLSGLKRRIANPLYELFVPRVRIPLSPLLLIT